MPDVLLYLWEIAVGISIFGIGATSLRLLGFRWRPLVLSGVLGVSFLIALGGVLNLLHLLRPAVFFALVFIGLLCAIVECILHRRTTPADASASARPTLFAGALFGAAIVIIGTMMLGGMQPTVWNGDDLQGYIPLGMKALQTHAIQPDPFCERRVVTTVGGASFLDAMMYATGDFRAMAFIDSTFGLLLYALGLWTLGRLLKTSSIITALALVSLPFATLIKVNLTIVYLSAAGLFAILILLLEPFNDRRRNAGRIVALGLILAMLASTKNTNLVFPGLFILAFVLLHWMLAPGRRVLAVMSLAYLMAAVVMLPWCLANKANAGTYFYPLFGTGFQLTTYHLLPSPAQIGNPAQLLLLLAPSMLLLVPGLLVAWKVTASWDATRRAALLAYLLAALITIPIVTYGLGGDGADRYTAPFLMPSLLLMLLVFSHAATPQQQPWRWLGTATLLLAAAYVAGFLGMHLNWYRDIRMLAYDAFRHEPTTINPWFMRLNYTGMALNLAYGARIQSSLAPASTAIEDIGLPYTFDFSRNRILLQDNAGITSPPPGLPIDATPEQARTFLRNYGVDYIILDRELLTPCGGLDSLLQDHHAHTSVRSLLHDEGAAHMICPWATVEFATACRTRQNLDRIVQHSPHVFDDGRILVADIR